MIPIPPRYYEQADHFFSIYNCEKSFISPDEKMKNLKLKSERICRFCKKKAPLVTFKNDANIFPMALGNKYLVSDFECDECNKKFGKYEDSLIKYLGLERTISKTPGRKNIPGFSSKNFKASKKTLLGIANVIKIESDKPADVFRYDPENNIKTIHYTKPPYIPMNVYKSLLKMALCLIDNNDVEKYADAFKFLTSENHNYKVKGLMLFGYRLPMAYENISGTLYKKLYSRVNTTTHTFVLCYRSFMLQIFLPFNVEDVKYYDNLEAPLLPPFFDGSGEEKWSHLYQINEDLSSSDIKDDDKEIITYSLQEEDLKKMVCFDPVTKKIINKPYDPSQVAMYLLDKDFTFKLDDQF